MLLLPRLRPPLTVRNKAVTAFFRIVLREADGDEIITGRIARNDRGQLRTDWFIDVSGTESRFFTFWDPDSRTLWHIDPIAGSSTSRSVTEDGWPSNDEWSCAEGIIRWTEEESILHDIASFR